VLGRREKGSSTMPTSEADVNVSQPPMRRSLAVAAFKEELRGRYFRCFDHQHHVSRCKNDTKCLHCLDADHISKGCPTSHLPRVPLPPLPADRRRPRKLPVHSRLVFPQDHPTLSGSRSTLTYDRLPPPCPGDLRHRHCLCSTR
jgi:hypothetical protein